MSRVTAQRACPNGHRYFKTSDCPTCPHCESERAPTDGWMAALAAPARRALEGAGIKTLDELTKRSEPELLALHGFGPATLPLLRKALKAAGMQFTTTVRSMRDLPKTSSSHTSGKPTNTNEYLTQLPADQRKALEALRKQILAAAPGCTEHFGYGLPGFKYNDHPMLYLGAAKNHVALYGSVPVGIKDRLKDFKVSKGTIQFTPEKPLPAALVKDIVKMKMAEIEVRWPKKDQKVRK
ncbi:MAG: DUF1801 domain-containing protein [Flavobacteriales bacterium]|nr:DUF1801 domain-containing protein [Flavobacteriales bacterium]